MKNVKKWDDINNIIICIIIDTMQINAKSEGFMYDTNYYLTYKIFWYKLIYIYIQVEVYKTLNTKLNIYYLVRSE